MSKTSAIALIILAIGLFYTFTSPQYSDAQGLNNLAAEYRNVVDNVDMISDAQDSLLTSFESIPLAEKERLAKVLPPNVDAVGLARDLDTIASRHGFSITDIEVEVGPDRNSGNIVLPEYGTAYDKAVVSFGFVSNYKNFKDFLNDLERSLRLMDIRRVSFQVGESEFYEHKITIETYWLK